MTKKEPTVERLQEISLAMTRKVKDGVAWQLFYDSVEYCFVSTQYLRVLEVRGGKTHFCNRMGKRLHS